MEDYELDEIAKLEGHTDRIWCVRWRPNGRQIATCSADRTIRLWSKEGDHWRCKSILGDAHHRTIRYIAWSHDGRYLASTSFDGTTAIWHETAGGKKRKQFLKKNENLANDNNNNNNNNNNSQHEDHEQYIGDDDYAEWSVLYSLEGHENEVKAAAWSPNDSYLATCSRDKSVWIWEKIETGTEAVNCNLSGDRNFASEEVEAEEEEAIFECASVQSEHTQDVKRVTWHPRLSILASASFDNDVLLYAPGDDDWHRFAALTGEHESTIWSIDFNCSGTRLVSVGADEAIKIWQPINFAAIVALLPSVDDKSGPKKRLSSSSNQSFALERQYAKLATKWCVIASLSGYHRYPIYDVSWSPLIPCIATGGADNSLHIFGEFFSHKFNDEFGQIFVGPEPKPEPQQQPESADNGNDDDEDSKRQFDDLRNVRYRQIVSQPNAHSQDINSVHWNPCDRHLLASGSDDCVTKVWRFRCKSTAT